MNNKKNGDFKKFRDNLPLKIRLAVSILISSVIFVFAGNFMKCFELVLNSINISIIPLSNCAIVFGIIGSISAVIFIIWKYLLRESD